jgi:hypothetical protein
VERQSRWQRARADTKGFFALKRELTGALTAVLLAVLSLVVFGSPRSAVAAEAIIGGAAIGGAVLIPVIELGWNYLRAPTRTLREDVLAIRAALDERGLRPEMTNAHAGAPFASAHERHLRAVCQQFYSELGTAEDLLNRTLERNVYPGGFEEQGFYWYEDDSNDFLAGEKGLEDVYQKVAEAYERATAEEIRVARWVRGGGDRNVNTFDRSSLHAALTAVQQARAALKQQVDRMAE